MVVGRVRRSLRDPIAYAVPPFREFLRVVLRWLQPVVVTTLVSVREPTDFGRCHHVALGTIRTYPGAHHHPIRINVRILTQWYRRACSGS
jgi:hypothetical protein